MRITDKQQFDEEQMEEKPRSVWREFLPYVLLLAAVILLRVFVLINANIPTPSMENTIPTGARVMGLKTTYWFSEPERGDIIVFHAPDEPETLYVKRVIGVPGDVVEVMDGVTYLNGEALVEDYLPEPMWEDPDSGPYNVPEGCYFVMGDNRNESLDARFWENTYVTTDAIVGKVYFSYWPSIRWIDGTGDETFEK